jgi:hypothetical protein
MSECAACGGVFECGMGGSQPCWCTQLPALLPVPKPDSTGRIESNIEASCYCPVCLKKIVQQAQAPLD